MKMADKATAAAKNRRIRQEALRDYLESRGLIEHIIDLVDKIDNEANEIPRDLLERYQISINTRLKLVSKYLPDLKQTELIGDPDQPVKHDHKHSITFVGVNANSN